MPLSAGDEREKRRRGFRRGHRGEWLAAWALRLKGFRILETRYRTRLGEIDLIARRGDLVAIVEVKARTSVVAAMDAVGPAAQRRIEAATDLWLARQRDHARLSIRFDLVAVLPRRWPVHVQGAWRSRNLDPI
ncbi:YraN family protein [Mangrovicella endophytica]|uniref:YraN family protein n=1 Tax=Mangrovicella endophytica TaxID=2066697 RepID=UPI000C9DE1FD|nr:YraN family protein [Mangrovicella endophytica]